MLQSQLFRDLHHMAREKLLRNLEKMTKFICFIFARYWMECTKAADAAVNDIQLYKDLESFQQFYPEVATAALKKVRLHTWYICPETMIFCLFSKKITKEDKEAIAAALDDIPRPQEMLIEMPETVVISGSTTLPSLVTEKSYALFNLLQVDHSWLKKDVEEWSRDRSFQVMERYVLALKVVNDTAERAVKLIHDYAKILTHDEILRQHIIQIVEYHRRKFPKYTKKALNK